MAATDGLRWENCKERIPDEEYVAELVEMVAWPGNLAPPGPPRRGGSPKISPNLRFEFPATCAPAISATGS